MQALAAFRAVMPLLPAATPRSVATALALTAPYGWTQTGFIAAFDTTSFPPRFMARISEKPPDVSPTEKT